MKKHLFFLIGLGLLLCVNIIAWAQGDNHFSLVRAPKVAGERLATAIVDLKNENPQNVSVFLYYSTNRTEVERNTSSSAQAKTKAAASGKISCEVIFPHRDHPAPNRNTDKNPKVYNHGGPNIFYKWVKKLTKSGSTQYFDDEVREFEMPRLFIIAYAGDSYAAGQGAPYSSGAKWDDDLCHRSQKSGGVKAIKKLISNHPEFAIRYVNVTCSGAETGHFTSNHNISGLTGAQGSKPPQLKQIEDELKKYNRDVVDIFLMGIGGNDVGFGPIGTSALLSGTTDIDAIKQMLATNLPGLAEAYDYLNADLQATDFEIGKVVLMGYADPTKAPNSGYCNPDVGGPNPLDCWGVLEKRLSQADFEFISKNFVAKLNDVQRQAAQKNGWDFVPINAGNHGLCNCGDGYFNTLGQSIFTQGDHTGTFHPNATGYREMYRNVVYNQLLSSLNKWQKDLKDDAKRKAIAEAKAQAKARIKQRRQQQVQSNKLALARKFKIPLKPLPQNIKAIPTSKNQDEGEDSKRNIGSDGN